MIAALALAAGLAVEPTTFNQDVAPIVARHCAECHRTGGAAPFSGDAKGAVFLARLAGIG